MQDDPQYEAVPVNTLSSNRTQHLKRNKAMSASPLVEKDNLSNGAAPVYIRIINDTPLLVDEHGREIGSQNQVTIEAGVDRVQTVTVVLAHQGYWQEEAEQEEAEAQQMQEKAQQLQPRFTRLSDGGQS